jgi:hypothetical protein
MWVCDMCGQGGLCLMDGVELPGVPEGWLFVLGWVLWGTVKRGCFWCCSSTWHFLCPDGCRHVFLLLLLVLLLLSCTGC